MAKTAITGQANFTSGLKRKLVAVGYNSRRVLGQKELEERMVKRVQKRFLQEVDPNGQPWVPLHPSTRKKYAVAGPNQILVDSGHMGKDIQVVRGRTATGPGTVRVRTGAGFSIGTPNTPYAAVHQFGTEDVPARPFLGINAQDVRSLVSLAQNILLGKKVRP